ncbi:MAG: helicase-related protein [Ilumatobacteraceae bacterium]
MSVEPLEFQRDAVAHHVRLLKERGASAEASVAGFGKTFVASFVARELQHPMVVCCPKVVIPHWIRAAAAVGAPVRCVSNYEQHKLGHTGVGQWEVRNRRWRWTCPKPTLLVFDEAHYCKTRTSQNAKLMVAAKRQGIPTLILSATLATDPTDLYAAGYLLGLHSGDHFDWQGFQSRYGVIRDGFGFVFDPRHDPTALRRLNAEMFPARGHRKSYDEIRGFPEATTDVRDVLGDASSLRRMEAAWARVAELEGLKQEAINAAVERLRARQLAEIAKVPSMIDLARDLTASGLSVPIFLNFHDSIDAVAAELKCPVIDGRTSDAKRIAAIDAFQRDEVRCLVLQTGAGGVGISLHDTIGKHPRHSLISPPENARDLIQALGRNRRVGQKTPSFRSVITLAGSIERRVKAAVERKASQIETINDGDLDPILA